MTGFFDSLKDVMPRVVEQRPSVGRWVRVDEGKRAGAVGIVRRHVLSRFGGAYRYASEAQAQLRDIAGRRGWRIQVETAEGQTFWVDADRVTVISGEEAGR